MKRAFNGMSAKGMSAVAVLGGVLIAGVVGLAVVVPARAATDPLDVIKARQHDMKQVGAAAKSVGAFLKDGKGTPADVAAAAATISRVAKIYGEQFPEGTAVGVGDSEALPAIWQDMPKFKADLAALDDAATRLAAAAATGDKDAIGKAMGAVGGACKQCHETFREKK